MHKARYVESLILLCAGLAFAGGALGAKWETVEESSAVTFTGTQQGSRFTGRFSAFEADIEFDPAKPEQGSIVGVVETGTVNTRDHDRDSALLERDWFDVDNHPEARFESERIEVGDNGAYRAHGQLTLKGETKPVVMDFTFDESSPEQARFSGTMNLNRFDFRVGDGWNDTSWIGEQVIVEVALDLEAAAAATTEAAAPANTDSGAATLAWNTLEDSSAVTFSGTQQGSRFTGRFAAFEADIAFDPAKPEQGRIVGVVETGTVNTRDHDRDSALLERDWFDVDNHPEARFESERIELGDNGAYRAHGQLALKGETKPVVMDFTFDVDESSPKQAHFSGTMSLNRFDFRVGEGWNDTSWIGEQVTVDVELDLAQ